MLDQKSKCVLDSFKDALEIYIQKSTDKINDILETCPDRRIHRIGSPEIVFDADSYRDLCKIRMDLCKKLPKYKTLIMSQPEILFDYNWQLKDYLKLFYNHYQTIIYKLKRIDNV